MSDLANRVYVGVDLGGTGIKGAIVRTDGSMIANHLVRTPIELGRSGILKAVEDIIAFLLEQAGSLDVAAIGIGSAGRIDAKNGTVIYATDNLPGWTGTPIAAYIGERFSLPVVVDNDVNVAAVGENWLGAAQGQRSFAFMALGTGVGGAVISGGSLIQGREGGAAELGHLILRPEGIPCNCGQIGCLEQYASGTALNRFAREIDATWNSRRLMEAFTEGDHRAQKAIEDFAANLAIGLINVQRMFDPDLIVMGGGLIDARHIWWEPLTQALQERTQLKLHLEPAALGNRAGLLGAARLAMLSLEA